MIWLALMWAALIAAFNVLGYALDKGPVVQFFCLIAAFILFFASLFCAWKQIVVMRSWR